MQEVSGIPFESYVQEKVLGPLGMKNTFAECRPGLSTLLRVRSKSVTEPSRSDISTFYTRNRLGGFRKAIPVNNFYKLAGGGYLSTSEDIAKLGQTYLEGKILNEETISQFLTSETVNGKPTYYGLGWQVSQDAKGRRFYGHVGNGVGGYSNFFVYPEEDIIFVILTNCTSPDIQKSFDEVVDVLLTGQTGKPLI